jgi:hypothetical protein
MPNIYLLYINVGWALKYVFLLGPPATVFPKMDLIVENIA